MLPKPTLRCPKMATTQKINSFELWFGLWSLSLTCSGLWWGLWSCWPADGQCGRTAGCFQWRWLWGRHDPATRCSSSGGRPDSHRPAGGDKDHTEKFIRVASCGWSCDPITGSWSWQTGTHISQSELPDGPLWRLRLREHLHADLSVHHRFICEGPVVITLHLKTHDAHVTLQDNQTGNIYLFVHMGAAERAESNHEYDFLFWMKLLLFHQSIVSEALASQWSRA